MPGKGELNGPPNTQDRSSSASAQHVVARHDDPRSVVNAPSRIAKDTNAAMPMRVANLGDVASMHHLRLSVRENALVDQAKVTHDDYRLMLTTRGRGWVFEIDGAIVAFGIADQVAMNIWALFVSPAFEGRGLGRRILEAMVEWLSATGRSPIWLTTEPGTRAERFYRAAGWRSVGATENGEIRFELGFANSR